MGQGLQFYWEERVRFQLYCWR